MLQLNSKNIPYQSVQVFLTLVSKFSDIANVLTEGMYDHLETLLLSEYVLINYPPSKFNDYLQFIKILSEHPAFSTIEKVLFVSSSSVYPKVSGIYHEIDEITSPSHSLYYAVEKSLHGKAHIILRCAGLMGAGRIAGKYYSNKSVSDGKSRVNHVHRVDVIRSIQFLIEQNLEGIFNICAPLHPTKEELFTYHCEQCQLPLPHFIESHAPLQRIIDGSKLERLGFTYLCEDPMAFLD